jgi:glucose-1-phosphate thymidylyltransferase
MRYPVKFLRKDIAVKGIILAGGRATRLYPVTQAVCKQLLPVYDKPMIYYPLSVLMLSGIRDILIISTRKDLPHFKTLFGDGRRLGLTIDYAVQPRPDGIAQALIIGEKFIDHQPVCLILGDNIFYGNNLINLVQNAAKIKKGATLFAYYVKDPQRYGVIEFDKNLKILSMEEKPRNPRSNWVTTGLYYYDRQAVTIAKQLKPSSRGELEITDVNKEYFRRGLIHLQLLGRGHAWLDTGTFDSLVDASIFIKTIEDRQGLKIGCIEEIAYRMGNIDVDQFRSLIGAESTNYNNYLRSVLSSK